MARDPRAPKAAQSPERSLGRAGWLRCWQARARTLAALACLWGSAPFLALLALIACLQHKLRQRLRPTPATTEKKLRILVTGGKMSKASAVARAVGRNGHTVVTAEISPYEFCHTRFCRYVSKHYVIPRPTRQPKEWEAAIKAIVAEHDINLIIPCTAPVESSAYAHLRKSLPPDVRVFAFDGATTDKLDNKFTFNEARAMGSLFKRRPLSIPQRALQQLEQAGRHSCNPSKVLVEANLPHPLTANMESLEDALRFFKQREASPDDGKRFIVKPAVYDPKARTEILFLPIPDKERQTEYLRSRNASPEVPYVIQEVLTEPECGSYAIFNKGVLTGFEFFESAASCLRYEQRSQQYQEVLELNAGLGRAMNLTGQLTLDLMHTVDGKLVPIECNPRIHSAICTLEGHPNLGRAFTDPDFRPELCDAVTSHPKAFRFWVMDQIFLRCGFWRPKSCFYLSLAEMAKGHDAMLHGDDPLPFLAMYLVQIPSLLLRELVAGTEWLKIDFCIGKIVKEGGD